VDRVRRAVPAPVIFTRRAFLQRTAAAGAFIAAGGLLGACTDDGPADPLAAGSPGPPLGEPPDTARITRVAVHPAVGIARVGNSADSFFFGPEIPLTLPIAPDGFKDGAGAMARQAARFRVYGYDDQGEVVRELTAADGTIAWTVSVANKKAAWYDFNTAMDIPVAGPVSRRNADVTGAGRDRLVVASGLRTITGVGAPPVPLDAGLFQDVPVPLGELLTDEAGRLVFMPASGQGYSPGQAPLTTFSDNDGWADDACDGPVLATVTLNDGRALDADPGWVVVTPPNYGPGLVAGLVTAYDSARLGWDTFDASALTAEDVSFRDDVFPILNRIVDMQWVNAGFFGSNGWGSEEYFLDPELLDRLADPSDASAGLRQSVFEQFRDPDYDTEQPDADPQMYGDGVAIPATSAYQWLTVTSIQYAQLQAWAAGTFTDDRDQPAPATFEEMSPREQTRSLDRAGLDSCLGGAYHPGIEVPWTLRVPSMWSAPLRLRVRSMTVQNIDYGDQLTPEATMAADGPLDGSGPGDLTRWQGTPWQSDAASCRSGYQPTISPVLPTFWPARIPNHVLRQEDYVIVVDTEAPMADRQAAFERRYDWERFVTGPNRSDTLQTMVASWGQLGIVTEQPGPSDGAFPAVMKVETNVGFTSEPTVNWNAAGQESNPLVWDGEPVTTSS
jgi:hypothetical protein